MCERLVQEYKIWFSELLESLHVICEDVVPVGRFNEDIYWRTKALYRECKCFNHEETYAELLQYVLDGKKLLDPVGKALVTVKTENIAEEAIVHLRRKHANAILNSLQMLVNFAYYADKYLHNSTEISAEVSKYFEIDVTDEVKRIRSGVVVERKQTVSTKREGCATNISKTKTYRFQVQKSRNWRGSVAGQIEPKEFTKIS